MEAQSQSFNNPVTFGSIPELLGAILEIVITIAIPIVVFFLILAGFRYVTARGNPEGIKQATSSLMYGIIGGVIIIGAFAILAIVRSVVDAF